MRIFLNTCGVVAVLFCLVYFAMQNNQAVPLTYYNGMTNTFPIWGIALVPFFVGVVVGNLLDVFQRFRLGRELKKLRRELRLTQNQAKR
jgi:uncharacterized integral membrane protein